MSKISDKFEQEIVNMVTNYIGEKIPLKLPNWMLNEGIIAGAIITGVEGIGSKDRRNKTDVIIYLNVGEPIKISAKLLNADYFGNWYGHIRFLEEFGEDAFYRMTCAATDWANWWSQTATAPYVGVSICFGRRSGNTAQNFTDIFTTDDILTVARGYGSGDSVANCMYIADHSAKNIPDLIYSIDKITTATVNAATATFKIAYRPINPMTEGTNRGKNVYTQFVPYRRLSSMTEIRIPKDLFELGEFQTVAPTRLNHNHILNELRNNYNIYIPRKGE